MFQNTIVGLMSLFCVSSVYAQMNDESWHIGDNGFSSTKTQYKGEYSFQDVTKCSDVNYTTINGAREAFDKFGEIGLLKCLSSKTIGKCQLLAVKTQWDQFSPSINNGGGVGLNKINNVIVDIYNQVEFVDFKLISPWDEKYLGRYTLKSTQYVKKYSRDDRSIPDNDELAKNWQIRIQTTFPSSSDNREFSAIARELSDVILRGGCH